MLVLIQNKGKLNQMAMEPRSNDNGAGGDGMRSVSNGYKRREKHGGGHVII